VIPWALAVVCSFSAAEAQDLRSLRDPLGLDVPIVATAATPNCNGGFVIDDGSFENGYGVQQTGTGDASRFLMRFGSLPGVVEQACVCLTRTPGGDTSLLGSVGLWDDNGPGGAPGTRLGSAAALFATDIPVFPAVRFYEVDMTSQLRRTDGSVYLGVSYIPDLQNDVFLCADETGPVKSPGYFRVDDDPDANVPWARLGDQTTFSDYSALGLRADILQDPITGGCVEDANTLCLVDDRFQVTVDFLTPQGDAGVGKAVELTEDTGYFWFFNQSNVELVIKVLDTCNFANRFWVFAGGLTNVEVEIMVVDTQTGDFKTYTNPQRTPFQPIQDTNAFATCP
jgi:hypothetical protein